MNKHYDTSDVEPDAPHCEDCGVRLMVCGCCQCFDCGDHDEEN